MTCHALKTNVENDLINQAGHRFQQRDIEVLQQPETEQLRLLIDSDVLRDDFIQRCHTVCQVQPVDAVSLDGFRAESHEAGSCRLQR